LDKSVFMQKIENITQHIIAYSECDVVELSFIVDALYKELCQVAQSQLNKLSPENINPQELVHEVYLKFAHSLLVNANGRRRFLVIAANAMRFLVIDQLRTNNSLKRGAHFCSTTLFDSKLLINDNAVEILYVHEAIEKLREIDEKLAITVVCKYFAGYSEQETTEALNVNVRTVRRFWQRAKRWLAVELTEENKNA